MSVRPLPPTRKKRQARLKKLMEDRLLRSDSIFNHPLHRPAVLSEWKTLEKILQDRISFSRFGDGEIKHMDGKRNVSQRFYPSLQEALKQVFFEPIKGHMVGIPNVYGHRQFLDVAGDYIRSMRRRFGKIADNKRLYGSSYISRGDCCPYLSWPTYWGVIGELWRDRDVVLVCGKEKRANPGMMKQAKSISIVKTPSSHAWSEYDRIRKECLKHPDSSVYLLCVGPTATVLAYDLCKAGKWAVDIGHLGLFYKHLGQVNDPDPDVWHHRPTDPGYIKGVTDQ